MKPKLFPLLRRYLRAADIGQAYLARQMNCSVTHIQSCLKNERGGFRLDEMYTILELLGLSSEWLPKLFPAGGVQRVEAFQIIEVDGNVLHKAVH